MATRRNTGRAPRAPQSDLLSDKKLAHLRAAMKHDPDVPESGRQADIQTALKQLEDGYLAEAAAVARAARDYGQAIETGLRAAPSRAGKASAKVRNADLEPIRGAVEKALRAHSDYPSWLLQYQAGVRERLQPHITEAVKQSVKGKHPAVMTLNRKTLSAWLKEAYTADAGRG